MTGYNRLKENFERQEWNIIHLTKYYIQNWEIQKLPINIQKQILNGKHNDWYSTKKTEREGLGFELGIQGKKIIQETQKAISKLSKEQFEFCEMVGKEKNYLNLETQRYTHIKTWNDEEQKKDLNKTMEINWTHDHINKFVRRLFKKFAKTKNLEFENYWLEIIIRKRTGKSYIKGLYNNGTHNIKVNKKRQKPISTKHNYKKTKFIKNEVEHYCS